MPETQCPGIASDLWSGDWVLKPALERVGEGVGISGITAPREMQEIAKDVARRPMEWAAQRRFRIVPVPVGDQLYYPCVGVYSVDGRAAGLYGRVGTKPLIDHDAQDAAVLIG